MAQWISPHAHTAGGPGSIPGQCTRSHMHAATEEAGCHNEGAHKPQLRSPPATTKTRRGTSLVAQWSRIRLPTQGTQVRALVREDPTCHRAAKPVRHNYLACALKPVSHNYWVRMPQLLKPVRLEPVLCNKRSHCNEKPAHCNKV